MHTYFSITKNKSLEIELNYFKGSTSIFEVFIGLNHYCDHAGFRLSVDIYKISFNFQIYDNRHWDSEKKEYIN